MKHEVLCDLSAVEGGQSAARLECTSRAFATLPALQRPSILDAGCGRGAPTLELAHMCDGDILAIDIDEASLQELSRKAAQDGLSERIRVEKRSMLEMDYPDGSFDLIWSEGAVFVMGFESALRGWRRLLSTGGYLVVHDVVWLQPDPPAEALQHWSGIFPTIQPMADSLSVIPGAGYRLLDHFPVPSEVWEEDYYTPMVARIQALRSKYAEDPDALVILAEKEREATCYRRDSHWFGSAFFIMQRDDDS